MSSTTFGARAKRFTVALALFIVGPMTLPGGPLDGDRLLALFDGLRVHARSLSNRAPTPYGSADSPITQSIAQSPRPTDPHVTFIPRGARTQVFLVYSGLGRVR